MVPLLRTMKLAANWNDPTAEARQLGLPQHDDPQAGPYQGLTASLARWLMNTCGMATHQPTPTSTTQVSM